MTNIVIPETLAFGTFLCDKNGRNLKDLAV